MDTAITTFLIIGAISVGVFIALREVTCWYFKINERNNLIKEQNGLLRRLLGEVPDNSEVKKQED